MAVAYPPDHAAGQTALAQLAPTLGALRTTSTATTRSAEAKAGGANLIVFPELGLTGYLLLQILPPRWLCGSTTRVWPRWWPIPAACRRCSFVEESADHRLFIAAALVEDGAIRHVHRKLFLPTYGLFDERRFFAAGDLLRAVPSGSASGSGSPCARTSGTSRSHSLLALDGAQILINVSSSPGRDLASTNEVGLGTATSWRTMMRTYAQLTTSFVVFCNRVGVDESISFWGGSEAIGPTGEALLSAPFYDEGLFTIDVSLGDVRRERIRYRCCATSARSCMFASCSGSSTSVPGWARLISPRSPAPNPGSTSRRSPR